LNQDTAYVAYSQTGDDEPVYEGFLLGILFLAPMRGKSIHRSRQKAYLNFGLMDDAKRRRLAV